MQKYFFKELDKLNLATRAKHTEIMTKKATDWQTRLDALWDEHDAKVKSIRADLEETGKRQDVALFDELVRAGDDISGRPYGKWDGNPPAVALIGWENIYAAAAS